MDERQFTLICGDLENNIEKVVIPKSEHISINRILGKGLTFAGESVASQYINLINPNINLATIMRKAKQLETVHRDKRYIEWKPQYEGSNIPLLRNVDTEKPIFYALDEETNEYVRDDFGNYVKLDDELNPHKIINKLVRWCELERKTPIYAYRHKKSGLVYGIVSPRHQKVDDNDVWKVVDNVLGSLPHSYQFEHNHFRMRIGVILDEISFELGYENSMKLRLSIGNSMFGIGSVYAILGSFETWCSNGAMGWRTKVKKEWKIAGFTGGFDWSKNHVYNPNVILRELENELVKLLSKGDKYIELLEEAHEINEPIFKKSEDVVKKLQSESFKLQKNEAEEVYNLLKHKTEQYKYGSGFDTGRAIAEVARDTARLDRRIELEQIASRVMFKQIKA